MVSVCSLTSCKDYDDDIQNLQGQIDAIKKAIESIQALINSGSVITNVEQTTNDVKVTLSNSTSFNLTNGAAGKDGAPGTAWTIGSDGYWYKDGVKTEYYALGTAGEKGDKGDQGDQGEQGEKGEDGAAAQGKYYVINAETMCLDLYEDGVLVKAGVVDLTEMEDDSVVAVLDGDNLVLTNGDVVLDGYILVHIARVTPATPSANNLNIDNYPVESATFDLCNAEDVYKQTTWIQTINRSIRTTLVGNTEINPVKYYFVPGVVEVFDAKENKTWYITPKSGAADIAYDDLSDKYIVTMPVHNYGTQAELNTLLNECAVDYASNAFNNVALYATDDLTRLTYTQFVYTREAKR